VQKFASKVLGDSTIAAALRLPRQVPNLLSSSRLAALADSPELF